MPMVGQAPAKIGVPYVDLAAQHAPLRAELLEAVGRVLDHGQFVLGEEVGRFEKAFSELVGTRYAVGLNSGSDALVLALKALDIQDGDEVITPPNSFIASTSCIALLRARPVFVDIREDLNLDPGCLEAAITPRTKAIVVVHLTGRPADMAPILEIARRRGLRVIEDAAQAVGARYRGQPVGSFGDIGCFSLHPLKTLNACGDGGMITTSDPALHERIRTLRNVGLTSRDDAAEWSGHSRLDTLQAAILLVKLKYLGAWTEQRRAYARFYQQRLSNDMQVPVDRPFEFAVYHTFVIQAEHRDALRMYLEQEGIGTRVHYPRPIHQTTIGATLGYGPGSLPVAERAAGRILSLPVYPELTRAQLDHVVGAIRHFYQQRWEA